MAIGSSFCFSLSRSFLHYFFLLFSVSYFIARSCMHAQTNSSPARFIEIARAYKILSTPSRVPYFANVLLNLLCAHQEPKKRERKCLIWNVKLAKKRKFVRIFFPRAEIAPNYNFKTIKIIYRKLLFEFSCGFVCLLEIKEQKQKILKRVLHVIPHQKKNYKSRNTNVDIVIMIRERWTWVSLLIFNVYQVADNAREKRERGGGIKCLALPGGERQWAKFCLQPQQRKKLFSHNNLDFFCISSRVD